MTGPGPMGQAQPVARQAELLGFLERGHYGQVTPGGKHSQAPYRAPPALTMQATYVKPQVQYPGESQHGAPQVKVVPPLAVLPPVAVVPPVAGTPPEATVPPVEGVPPV